MVRRTLHPIWITALLASTGCGGGGGGNSSGSSSGANRPPGYPLTITVSQNPITASVPQVDLPSGVSFNASVRGSTSASTLYVVITDSAATFSGAPSVGQSGAMEYQATLQLADTLTIGPHSGNLQISICSDPNCANVLGRTMAPYAITVAENPVLTGSLSKASVALTMVRGDEPVNWPIRLTTPLFQYIPRARFSDAANVLRLAGDAQTVVAAWGTTDLAITVSPDTPAGTYSGNLDMVYCRDPACNKMYRGVTRLPYTVTVYALSNLKPLAAVPGATDWYAVQGSSAHTGHVPITLNPSNFSPRWIWRSPDRTNIPQVLEPVTSAGKVFALATPEQNFHITPILFAIDEASGEVAWQQAIPDTNDGPSSFGLGPLTPPAIAGNNVYVARTVNNYPPQEGRLFAFRVADGTSAFTPQNFPEVPANFGDFFYESFGALSLSYGPVHMTPRGSSMVLTGQADGNWSGNLVQVALDLTTGARTELWSTCPAAHNPTRFAGAVAVDANGGSYLATNAGLLMADTCETIASPASLSDGFGPAIVPGTSRVVAEGGGSLVSFDTATRQVKWSAVRSDLDVFVGSPAIVDGTVYVQNNSRVQLEARRESDGEVLWTWQVPWSDDYSFIGNVVATDNLVFVSTRRRIYAIDRTTHQAVWIYPYPGKLAISANGVLYVRRGFAWSGVALAAINLH